jgi:hypothetical protein
VIAAGERMGSGELRSITATGAHDSLGRRIEI